MSAGVGRDRYTRSDPCPICGGWPTLPQGKGVRCYGFRATGGRSVFCTREEHAGNAPLNAGANAYKHWLRGDCTCGLVHGEPGPDTAPRAERQAPPEPEGPPPLDPDTLDAVLTRYLELCPLRPEHRDYFASRGEADLAVALAHRYGSLPLGYAAARRVVDTLTAEFGADTILRTPGFYAKSDGSGRILTHTAYTHDDAAVIPSRDEHGRINGLVRRTITGDKAKYRVFKGGGADFYAIAGPAWAPGDPRHLQVVEGTHKAYVAAHLGGGRVFGMPAAHLSAAHAAAIARLEPDTVIECLDADKWTTPSVGRQRTHMWARLSGIGCEVRSAVWELQDGKGIDDLLANGRRPRLRTVARRPAVTARTPRPTQHPAPVPPGRPLADVQTETAGLIRKCIRGRRTRHGRLRVFAGPPGVGKTTAAVEAVIEDHAVARIVVATKAKADELAKRYPGHIRSVEGRNADNCQNFETVEAARRKGHDVASLVCVDCPVRDACRDSGYYSQFEGSGSLVGPVEMAYSGVFLRRGEVVILDDPNLERAMIDTRKVTSEDALHLASTAEPGPVRKLLTVVSEAIDAERASAAFAAPLIGPTAWDALARTVGGADRLAELVLAAAGAADTRPQPADGATLTAEDIDAAPPAVLSVLVRLLNDELGSFAAGEEFNSGLSLHPGGLELRTLRPPLVDRETGVSILKERAILVLDATPILPLYQRFGEGLVIEPTYRPEVALPPNVTITQAVDRFFGKTATTRPKARAALLASLRDGRERYPGDREAAICAKGLRDDVAATGIPNERVLTFHGNRGLNTIEDADVLHLLGRPQAPDYAALQLAQVLHKDEAPILPHLAMHPEGYAGYRADDGSGREIDVLDFEDARASALFRANRETELVQSIHRARLFRVAGPQAELFEPEGAALGRRAALRQRVRVVIHTAHPIPGLRVDELTGEDVPQPSANQTRAAGAEARVLLVRELLEAEGQAATVSAVARAGGASRNTVADILNRDLLRGAQAVSNSFTTNQPEQAATNPAPSASAPSSVRAPRPDHPRFSCREDAWRERPTDRGGGWLCGVCHPPIAAGVGPPAGRVQGVTS